jgi:hypothetical protein
MKRRRHTPEQIVRKLSEADRLLGEGMELPEVTKQLEVSEVARPAAADRRVPWRRWPNSRRLEGVPVGAMGGPGRRGRPRGLVRRGPRQPWGPAGRSRRGVRDGCAESARHELMARAADPASATLPSAFRAAWRSGGSSKRVRPVEPHGAVVRSRLT